MKSLACFLCHTSRRTLLPAAAAAAAAAAIAMLWYTTRVHALLQQVAARKEAIASQ